MFPGVFEILLILAVVALVIGPKRIANMGRSLGRGVYDFVDELGTAKKDRELPEDERDREEDRKE